MSSVTLEELVLASREEADQQTYPPVPLDTDDPLEQQRDRAQFITNTEATRYVNEGLTEFHDLILNTYQDWVVTLVNVTLVNLQEKYSLPEDFYKMRSLYFMQGTTRVPLEEFQAHELGDLEIDRFYDYITPLYYSYRVFGDDLYVYPKPNGAGTLEMWYIPQAVKLRGATDKVNYTVMSGWEEYIINHAAMKMLMKEESDVSAQMQRKAQLTQRIQLLARKRNASRPLRMRDVRSPRRGWAAKHRIVW